MQPPEIYRYYQQEVAQRLIEIREIEKNETIVSRDLRSFVHREEGHGDDNPVLKGQISTDIGELFRFLCSCEVLPALIPTYLETVDVTMRVRPFKCQAQHLGVN